MSESIARELLQQAALYGTSYANFNVLDVTIICYAYLAMKARAEKAEAKLKIFTAPSPEDEERFQKLLNKKVTI